MANLELEFLRWLTSQQTPWLNILASFLTFLGGTFYFMALPLVYFFVSKRVGLRIFLLFIVSLYLNSVLRVYWGVSRPVGVEGISSLFIDTIQGDSYRQYSFPSGHAQSAMVLWGYLAYHMRSKLFWWIAWTMIALISFSRLYAGVHWPSDVLGGIVLGLILLFAMIRAEARLPSWTLPAGAIIILVLSLLAFLNGVHDRLILSSMLAGSSLGAYLEQRYLRLDTSGSLRRKLAGSLLFFVGLYGLNLAAKGVLTYPLNFLLGFWCFYLTPYLLIATGFFSVTAAGHTETSNQN